MTFGEKLRLKRQRRGWSLKKMSDITDISWSTLKDYETDISSPRLSTLLILADTLEFSIDSMLERTKYVVRK